MPTFTAGQTLTAGDLNEIGDPPLAHLRQTVAQSIANTTWTAILFETEDYDTHNGHSTLSNLSRYVAPRDGMYEVAGCICWDADAVAHSRWSRWAKNGAEVNGSAASMANITVDSAQTMALARTTQVRLAAGDYLELQGWHNGGASRSTYAALLYAASSATIKWVGP